MTSSPSEDCLFEIAASQGGYFTAAQARDCGYSWSLLSHHVSNGRFVRARRGLYRFRQYPCSPREEVIAVWLAAGPESVVSHENSLGLFGLADTRDSHARPTAGRRSPAGRARRETSSQPAPRNKHVKYRNAAACRTALEARLLARSKETGLSLVRLRKAVVFDRLLARLMVVAPGRWFLKGALALDYRLGDRTRTAKRALPCVTTQAASSPADVSMT